MNKSIVQKATAATLVVFVILSVFLAFNKAKISMSPWDNTGNIEWPTYAGTNEKQIAVIENSEKAVSVIDADGELVFRLNADPNSANSFFSAEFVVFDDDNNLYVLDKRFAGAFEENTERILKYSPAGKFLGEIYGYRYINENFIITKGKICGITWFEGAVYLVRLENDGFYLERISTSGQSEPETVRFFSYPNAFRDLVYSRINVQTGRLTFTSKARTLRHYDFSGALIGEWPAEEGSLPWSAVSDNNNNIIYADTGIGALVFLDTATGERSLLFSREEGSSYAYINYVNNTLLAASDDDLLIRNGSGEFKILSSYNYSPSAMKFRMTLFILCLLDALALLVLIAGSVFLLSKITISGNLKRILLVGTCVAFGAASSSVLIINAMNDRYYKNIYTDLENVSRLVAESIDINIFTSITASSQYEKKEYLDTSDTLGNLLSLLPVKGMNVYQYIWMERDGVVYSMYDSERALGVLYPFFDYEDSYYQDVVKTKKYVHTNDITATGSWLFACGPIFDESGNVVAAIETGYSMSAVLEQTRNMIVQTVLIVIATTIAFLLIMIEFILIMNAYKKNKLEWRENAALPFRPELLRAIVFFQFFAANLATALLPMYSARLYEPIFNLPQEFVVTFPFTANTIFVVLSQFIVPGILKKIGIKKTGVVASMFFVLGNGLCFTAVNVVSLSLGYAFIGFSGGALVLVVNTVISARKNVEEVNSGFAHYNASFLAGVNVGVVCGSIIAQFFPYRIVFLFAAISAMVMFFMVVVSTRSKYLRHFYDTAAGGKTANSAGRRKTGEKKAFAFFRFILKPAVLVTLFLALLPYVTSMSFTEFFLPVFGTDNGLGESNVGQLILLSGLFAILFGTSLCKYFGQKFPIKAVLCFSLLLNAAAIYLFSINVSIVMLIAAVVIIAVANIFALTNIQTYYATLYQGSGISSMTALSFYAIVENAAMMVGPIVFSYILASNIAGGMKIFSVALLVCLVVFMVVSTVFGKRKKPGLGLLDRARQIRESMAA
jgi:predicted MFS family arabinose efflux permease